MSGWTIPNRARAERKLIRRAPFLAAVGSGMSLAEAIRTYGIPRSTAKRYRADVR